MCALPLVKYEDVSVAEPERATTPQQSNVRRLRLNARARTDLSAVMIAGSTVSAVRIRNISKGGAGLQTSEYQQPGTKVTLHLLDGQTLRATVLWSRYGFCGVEFDKLLDEDDLLLGSLAKVKTPIFSPSPTQGANPTNGQQILRSHRPIIQRTRRIRAVLRSLRRQWQSAVDRCMTYRYRSRLMREFNAIARACRKQGFSWLTD